MITGTTVDTTNNTFLSGGANWRKNSLVKISGKIGECVLGASDGTITNINISNHQMTITATIANAADISVRNYTASEISDFAVMLYKLHNGTTLFPIGIVLTSYGSDRKSYIDVYGGIDAAPVARMGNLGGLKYKDYSDPSSTAGVDELTNQWGFYTRGNAYFEGHIKTSAGIIGGWEITSGGLRKGTLGAANSIYLIPTGSDATNGVADIGGSGRISGWAITSSNTFGVTIDGKTYMSNGKIAGWTIDVDSIFSGTTKTSNAAGNVRLSTTDFSRTINGVQRDYLRFAIGSNFAVNNAGTLVANGAILSGNITATTGSIGGM